MHLIFLHLLGEITIIIQISLFSHPEQYSDRTVTGP